MGGEIEIESGRGRGEMGSEIEIESVRWSESGSGVEGLSGDGASEFEVERGVGGEG